VIVSPSAPVRVVTFLVMAHVPVFNRTFAIPPGEPYYRFFVLLFYVFSFQSHLCDPAG
jgi:hypothetical protein